MDNELKKIIDDIENNRIKGLDSLVSRASEKIASILNKSLNKEEITEKESQKIFLIQREED